MRPRISEQEARIIFANAFMRNNIPFAVEVPTQTVHSQKGTHKMSGRYDMAVYSNTESCDFEWIIELKAHNCPEESIRKDIEKMVMSNKDCIWFHVFKNEDSGTRRTVLDKFNCALTSEMTNHECQNQWIIAFIILDKSKLYLKTVHFHDGQTDLPLCINEFCSVTIGKRIGNESTSY
jgi:hypothetical protein